MTKTELIKKIAEDHGGILTLDMLKEHNIPRQCLKKLIDEEYLIRCARGVYNTRYTYVDEYYVLSKHYKNAIFSHNTALYFYNLTDRTPFLPDLTFTSNVRIDKLDIQVHYINKERFELGLTKTITPCGAEIRIYNLERTICDIIRDRNKIDSQIFNDALKGYMKRKDKNLNLLYEYAKEFKILKILKMYLEVLS